MQQSNQISVDISPGSLFPIVLGKSKTIDFLISNTSSNQKAYNVSIIINLRDSLEITSSSIQATNVKDQVDGSKNYNFINAKDLAPNEIDYKMQMVVKSNENYKNGTPVAFQTKLQSTITITWDSMPRGSYDAGNIQYYNSVSYEFEIARLSLKKTMPSVRVKGAGTEIIYPSKIFDCVIEVENNTREETTFNMLDSLPDTIRYLGDITIVSPIQNPLPNPVISYDTKTGSKSIGWKNCILIQGELLKLQYKAAIWNNYALDGIENAGSRILHGTNLSTEINASNEEFQLSSIETITAMDTIITVTDNKKTVDVTDVINYTLNIEVNQYYSIKNVTATFFTPDGQEPLNTTGGTILPEDLNYAIPVEYRIAKINKNAVYSILLTASVLSQYRSNLGFVSCGDIFVSKGTLTANNFYDDVIEDSSSSSQNIIIPTISKRVVQVYDRDLKAKITSTAVAPLDWIEYELSFDSSFIIAAKRNILLDDFFPLETRMPNIEDIEQISGVSIVPEQISPFGLRWNLGNVVDQTPWTIRLKAQVGTSITETKYNNLFKLTGSTNAGTSYSDRRQVSILTGKPNLIITRFYDDFIPTNVYGGVEYSCRLNISNAQNDEGTATDAFGFQVAEQTYNGITVVPNSWSMSGTGLYTSPQGSSNFITAQILRLYVGQDITISYKITLPWNIYPGFTGNLASQVGIPYTQIIDSLLENVLYSMSAPVSTAQLKTKNISFSKTYTDSILKVGSHVNYSVQYIVPKGTSIYNAVLIDDLPADQELIGEVFLNGVGISVTVENEKIIFPEIMEINPTESDAIFNYTFTTVINSAQIVFPISTQVNKATLTYKNYLNNTSSRSATKNVLISHPLLTVSLTALNGTVLDNKTTFNIRLNVENKSTVGAKDCVVQLPVPENAVFISAYSQLGTVSLDGTMLTWNIGTVSGLQSGFLSFSFKGNPTILVTDSIEYKATLLNYKNDLSNTMVYPQITTNTLIYACIPSVKLSVYPANRTLNGKGFFQFSSNSIVEAPYSIINQSGGIDSFALNISPIKWPYDLFINEIYVASVEALTPYSDTPSLLFAIGSGNEKEIKLKIFIPDLLEEDSDRFSITSTSLADQKYADSIETTLLDP